MKINRGDIVNVIGQHIFGLVLAIHEDTNEVVIQDYHSEYEAPEDQLIYRKEELKLLLNRD